MIGEREKVRVWFIPTGVGKTEPSTMEPSNPPVHPHGRGENLVASHSTTLLTGSSPRAWGKPGWTWTDRTMKRFIPTGVGKTRPAVSLHHVPAVHPHGRGENFVQLDDGPVRSGSSPRAWGKPAIGAITTHERRFIPTGVGKTLPMVSAAVVAPGSSPRAWGKPPLGVILRYAIRFIPTGVGKTVHFRVHVGGTSVHPHGRGENECQSTTL